MKLKKNLVVSTYRVQIVVLNHQNLIQGGPRGGASNDQESNFSPHKSSEGSIFFTPTKKWTP